MTFRCSIVFINTTQISSHHRLVFLMALVHVLIQIEILNLPIWLHAAITVLLALSIFAIFPLAPIRFDYPFINYDKQSWTYRKAKRIFQSDARRLLLEGAVHVRLLLLPIRAWLILTQPQRIDPFGLITDDGPVIVLSPDYIESVNQEPCLSLKALAEDVRYFTIP
jgi:hypothetical protein